MGWDLCGRRNESYFRVNLYGWPRLRLALGFLGADTEKMATDNSGKYVPAAVAKRWAEAIERGIDSLSLAVIAPRSRKGEQGWFIVPKGYGRREVRQLLRDYYGERDTRECQTWYYNGRITTRREVAPGHWSYRLLRIDPLPDDYRDFLLGFAKFCRESGGFYQW